MLAAPSLLHPRRPALARRRRGRPEIAPAEELHGRYFLLAPERFALLIEACAGHTDARFNDDSTVGACFDSDRLNLWRVGKTPDAKYLSTDAALDDDLQHWSKSLHGHARDWEVLLQAYTA